jgi:toxin-antitoxin system PIN domain toxin
MILCDVSVLVAAGMPDSPHHPTCLGATREMLDGESFAISELVLSAVVRISTAARIWARPTSLGSAFAYVNALRTHPAAVAIAPGRRHWRIFEDLVHQHRIQGGDVTDAYLAALAIEQGCEWWTIDGSFARFDGLRWKNLLTR